MLGLEFVIDRYIGLGLRLAFGIRLGLELGFRNIVIVMISITFMICVSVFDRKYYVQS